MEMRRGESSRYKNASYGGKNLDKIVLSWSLEDILNEANVCFLSSCHTLIFCPFCRFINFTLSVDSFQWHCSPCNFNCSVAQYRNAFYTYRFRSNFDICSELALIFIQGLDAIPNSFSSIKDYQSSFVYPLIEETRSELCSKMESMSTAPFAETINFCPSESLTERHYDILVEKWTETSDGLNKVPYETKPGDIIVFTQAKPDRSTCCR